jgi:Dynein attachment factor N-terminus
MAQRETSLSLDASGNIDADKLSRELTAALEFDIDYKKKDNMKKRAIRVAPSYDAFKNMVACAGLKTVR